VSAEAVLAVTYHIVFYSASSEDHIALLNMARQELHITVQ